MYCRAGQPAVALEPVNPAGNLACRDSGACQVRAALNTDGRDVPEQMGDIAAVLNQLARNADNGLFPSQVASALREIATHVTALAAQVDPEVVAVQPPRRWTRTPLAWPRGSSGSSTRSMPHRIRSQRVTRRRSPTRS